MMKKLLVMILILVLPILFISSVYADAETDIFNELKSMGFNNAYVAIEDDSLLMRFETPAISANFSDILLTIAIKGYEKYPAAKTVVVESYINDSPAAGVIARGEDIAQWKKGALSDNDLYDRADFIDLRSEEQEIRDDLSGFNALADEVAIGKNTVNITMNYFGEEKDFLNDFAAMAFTVVQDVPYADTITFTYLPQEGDKYLVMRTNANDILSLYDGSLPQDDFLNKLYTKETTKIPGSVSGTSIITNFFKKIFGGINTQSGKFGKNFISNPLMNLLASVILFLFSIVFFFMGRSRRKRIAGIVKTRKISLSHFPNREKVYGKLVGIIDTIQPLQAPFSKKNVVMYNAQLQELRTVADDEDRGSKEWTNIWRDKKEIDFFVKDLNGDNSILIKKDGKKPKIDLPYTFKREIRNKQDPIVQPFVGKGIFSWGRKRFRAVEKALEKGRKVFFIGGIKHTESGFEFIERPHYLNMISVHSEKRLTSHYRKLSIVFTFFAIIFILVSIYLILRYFGMI